MARPLRLEFAGLPHHVASRGDRREAIYEDGEDRVAFLNVLAAEALKAARNQALSAGQVRAYLVNRKHMV